VSHHACAQVKVDELIHKLKAKDSALESKTEECAELRKALEARNKQLGVACTTHDLTHALACGLCFEYLRSLLDEVRCVFTQDDDLPNNLLNRIDAAMEKP
jgi:hypothetical protein